MFHIYIGIRIACMDFHLEPDREQLLLSLPIVQIARQLQGIFSFSSLSSGKISDSNCPIFLDSFKGELAPLLALQERCTMRPFFRTCSPPSARGTIWSNVASESGTGCRFLHRAHMPFCLRHKVIVQLRGVGDRLVASVCTLVPALTNISHPCRTGSMPTSFAQATRMSKIF